AESNSCIIRSLASVPMAENMSANFATCSIALPVAFCIFPCLQKYRQTSRAKGLFRLARDTGQSCLVLPSNRSQCLFQRDSFGLERRKASWYLRSVRSRRQQVRAKGQAHCQSEG